MPDTLTADRWLEPGAEGESPTPTAASESRKRTGPTISTLPAPWTVTIPNSGRVGPLPSRVGQRCLPFVGGDSEGSTRP